MSEIKTVETLANIEDLKDHHRRYHITHLRKEDRYTLGVDPCGGITLAFTIRRRYTKPSGHPGFTIFYGIALCKDEDRYDKKFGREAAIGRANDAGSTLQSELFSERLYKRLEQFGELSPRFEKVSFTGGGKLGIDLAPEMVTAKNELVPSRFLHVAVVREIVNHARVQCRYVLSEVWADTNVSMLVDAVYNSLAYQYTIDNNRI